VYAVDAQNFSCVLLCESEIWHISQLFISLIKPDSWFRPWWTDAAQLSNPDKANRRSALAARQCHQSNSCQYETST